MDLISRKSSRFTDELVKYSHKTLLLMRKLWCLRLSIALSILLFRCPKDRVLAAKRCEHEGCKKVASYGDATFRQRLFCLAHKAAQHVYLVGKLCQYGTTTTVADAAGLALPRRFLARANTFVIRPQDPTRDRPRSAFSPRHSYLAQGELAMGRSAESSR